MVFFVGIIRGEMCRLWKGRTDRKQHLGWPPTWSMSVTSRKVGRAWRWFGSMRFIIWMDAVFKARCRSCMNNFPLFSHYAHICLIHRCMQGRRGHAQDAVLQPTSTGFYIMKDGSNYLRLSSFHCDSDFTSRSCPLYTRMADLDAVTHPH